MAISALLFATNTQHIDVVGPLLKPLLPFLIAVAILKGLMLFMPKKRRRQKPRAGKRSPSIKCGNDGEKAILLGIFGIILALVQLFSGAERIRAVSLWILVFFLSMLACALGAWLIWVGKNKGRLGEMIVSLRLGKGLPQEEYCILDNLYLPIEDGGTTQIDHVVVSRFGVFVVETKNYSGWIFADASSKVWTQTLYHSKNAFQNPIRQNYRHVCAIAENLGLPKEYIRGVVAFTGDCEFKTPMPEGVVYSRQLADYIKSFSSPILKDREKEEIVAALREWGASVTPEQRSAHVDNLRRRQKRHPLRQDRGVLQKEHEMKGEAG